MDGNDDDVVMMTTMTRVIVTLLQLRAAMTYLQLTLMLRPKERGKRVYTNEDENSLIYISHSQKHPTPTHPHQTNKQTNKTKNKTKQNKQKLLKEDKETKKLMKGEFYTKKERQTDTQTYKHKERKREGKKKKKRTFTERKGERKKA